MDYYKAKMREQDPENKSLKLNAKQQQVSKVEMDHTQPR